MTRLIDLLALDWPPLEFSPDGLRIAATCTLARLAAIEAPPEWRAAALFARCCRALLGSFKIWNAATVGGNLCAALPAAPMAALAVALDGICTVWTFGGERLVPAASFITAPMRTILRPGDILRAVHLPAAALRRRVAYRQISLTPLGRSAALLIGTRDATGAFSLTVTASTPRPVRLDFSEPPTAFALRDGLAREIPEYFEDVHGTPAWRRAMTALLAEEIRAELA